MLALKLPPARDRDADYIGHLAGVYSWHGCRGRKLRLLMLTAYLDESGTQPDQRLCVVAGYAADEDEWKKFIPEWMDAIAPRQRLHIKEMRWNNASRIKSTLERAAGAINRFNLEPMFGGVWHRDHQEIVAPITQDVFASPYVLAFQNCIIKSLNWLPRDEEIAFVFEVNNDYEWAVEIIRKYVFELMEYDSRVRGITPVKAGETPCTDVADYLAFAIRETEAFRASEKAVMVEPIFGERKDLVGHISTRDELRQNFEHFRDVGVLLEPARDMVPKFRKRKRYDGNSES